MIPCPIESPARHTQGFGARPEVYKKWGLLGHNGKDYTGPVKGVSVPIYAPFDGIIAKVAYDAEGYGNYLHLVTSPDPSGRRRDVVLGHFRDIDVEQGQWIAQYDPLGMMGNTGFSSGMHVHVGLRFLDIKGQVINKNNGYGGYIDFAPYLVYWKKSPEGMVTFV